MCDLAAYILLAAGSFSTNYFPSSWHLRASHSHSKVWSGTILFYRSHVRPPQCPTARLEDKAATAGLISFGHDGGVTRYKTQ